MTEEEKENMKKQTEEENEENEVIEHEGNVQQSVGAIIMVIVGVGVAVLILIFVGALGGQTWNLVEDDINNIQNNTTKQYIKEGVVSGFQALKSTGGYLPIVVLAVIIFVVLGLVLGMTGGGLTTGGGYSGGAL